MSLLANSNAIESGGYNIDRSLRFRSSASAYLNRTPASAGNRKTWTWSGWVKRGAFSRGGLFGSNTSAGGIGFGYGDVGGTNWEMMYLTAYGVGTQTTSAVFRDPSAWYHVVLAFDSTQATASNRARLYVNNQEFTFGSSIITLNSDYHVNSTNAHWLGNLQNDANFDGYLAEVNFIDGQALTPSSFGQTDAVTGVWIPKKYAGTYGTNGFYLDFKNNTSATTLAYDKSGNGNNWTANNISTTAGATYDSMTDVPTLTSATAANYCVLNPLNKDSGITLSNGNMQAVGTNGSNDGLTATFGVSSGKWYLEAVVTNIVAYTVGVGFVTEDWVKTYIGDTATAYFGLDTTYGIRASAGITASGSTVTFGLNDVVGVAFDADLKTATIYKNNTSVYSYSNIPNVMLFPAINSAGNTVNVNFGQRPFSYTPPTGFKALNTFNLPDPVIKKPNQYMDATTYTGNGNPNNTTQTIVNSGSMQPDFVWIKSRSNAYNNSLFDSVRGIANTLASNSTSAEDTTGTTMLTALNSNGFTVGSNLNGSLGSTNVNGATYVGWQWKESATAGFDIVTFTSPASGNFTVNHSLGVTPAMVIVKTRDTAGWNWHVWHKSLSSATNSVLVLNGTNAVNSSFNMWGATGATSSNIGVTTGNPVPANSACVAYLFAEIAGFSKFGSYTGNGSADGPFVYCGFRPKFIMIKRTDASGQDWILWDASRPTYNTTYVLYPSGSYAEDTAGNIGDILSNGFKPRTTGLACNANGATYIYACFSENPFKYSLAR